MESQAGFKQAACHDISMDSCNRWGPVTGIECVKVQSHAKQNLTVTEGTTERAIVIFSTAQFARNRILFMGVLALHAPH